MRIRNLLKLSVILPVIIGIIIGTALFIFGEDSDAPGVCLIGLIIAFLLIMLGVYKAGIVNKGRLAVILPLCFGTGSILLSVVLQLDGELSEMPAVFYTGLSLGAILICFGIVNLIKYRISVKL